MSWRRLSGLLCLVNWLGFCLFLAYRRPHIDARYERTAAATAATFEPMGSGQPAFHIAGRPMYDWNSWHGGEVPVVKLLAIANYPALVIARGLAPAVSRLLFKRIGTYSLESWVLAWIFVVLASVQWVGVAWFLSRLARMVRERKRHDEASR